MNKNTMLLALIGLGLLSITLTLLTTKQKQEVRSRASASTTITFYPDSTPSNPLQKNTGDTIPLDIKVNPGTNLVTFVKFQVQFDPTKISLAPTNAFIPNIDAFPSTVEGPVTTSNSFAVSVSIGGDPTKAIQAVTKLGTLNFKAVGPTNGTPTQITFTTSTQVLSSATTDQAGENVLSTTVPANIAITGTAVPTATPSATLTPSPTLTVAPTPISTTLKLNVLLHGVGSAGDNPNPQASSLSNKNPLHPQRNASITVYDSNNQVVSSVEGAMIYDNTGSFPATIDLGKNFATGDYSVKLKTDRYLRKQIPGIIHIVNMQSNQTPQVALVAGDVKDDNVLNVLDYNILLDCGYGAINPLPLADPNSIFNSSYCKSHGDLSLNADIDDNGIVNSPDYNLFLRELSVQNGD